MTTREEWLALAARLEAATGPDREINGAIALALGWTFQKMKGDRVPYWRTPGEDRWFMRSPLPRYTASIDAAVSAVEREFPDWQYGFTRWRDVNGGCQAWVDPNNGSLRTRRAATPALALMAALCRAKAETQKEPRPA